MTPKPAARQAETIAAAEELFWRQGYDETSIEDVVQATGLNRYALYNAFGGKRELFLKVLQAYQNERKTLFLSALSDPKRGPFDAIREVSEYCIGQMVERAAGCLMCDVALDVSRRDEIIAEEVRGYLNEIRCAQEMALKQAKERGELHGNISPKEGAALLVSNMLGASALARNGASRREIINVLNTCMKALSNSEDASKRRSARNENVTILKQP